MRNDSFAKSFLLILFFFKRKEWIGSRYLLQSRMTLPDIPLFMASKPFWNSV